MKAIRVRKPGGLDNLYLDEIASPPPAQGEVTVRLHASSLNYHDYLVAIGVLPTEDGRIPLSDGAGEVIALGDGVTEFAVGDKVVGTFFADCPAGKALMRHHGGMMGDRRDGYARQEITLPVTGLTPMPAGYHFAEAATLPCAGVTAWRALVINGGIKPGDSVLVQGSGGVSVFALQFAKAAGCRVIATSSSDEKLERLKALGADELINYRSHPKWSKEVQRLTDGKGVDHVVEVGGAGTFGQSIYASAEGGHIAMIGVLAGRNEGAVPTDVIMGRQLRVQGVIVGSRQDQLDMIRAIDQLGIRPVADTHFPLEALADAFRCQERGGHFGKIVIDID
ncbi:NAD(P)-dependent alcohol dehydrogenase [Spongiibacter taiwanensis]|uniref:zinc-dependent alcohol dehydrogenase family protein n=1 Tax=Spongiibacter taiwanensis TaxID=1748242 RepID=UPI002034C918|nr:NAD(P)-dependent alcohol dehydrogenase [Spongiibacter taiwanensis]USA44039.1 NAD(P)-dependent alcohol dehydrogenase [Spongiibacter taiwanensis]